MPGRREDVFVSLCIAEAPASARDVEAIVAAAHGIAAAFRYYELLIVAQIEREDDELLRQCLLRCPNIRILRVRGSSRHYSHRVVVASEAIGDVVVITALSEIGVLDLIGLITAAVERNTISVYARRDRAWGRRGVGNALLALLGSASRFRVSISDMRTIAIPRTWLNQLLAHPQANLALRFPPLDEGFPVHHIEVRGLPALKVPDTTLVGRIGLLYGLAIHASPVLLAGIGWLSAFVIIGAVLFGFYAIGALFLVAHLQDGWFTTSIVQAGTAGYLGIATLGLSLGLQKLLANSGPHIVDTIVGETTNTDLFADIQELNVSVDVERITLPVSPVSAP